jgi:hypothetical protein
VKFLVDAQLPLWPEIISRIGSSDNLVEVRENSSKCSLRSGQSLNRMFE